MNKTETAVITDKLADELAGELVKEISNDPSKSLLTPGGQKERLKGEIARNLDSHFASVAKGITQLLERSIQLIQANDPRIDQKAFQNLLTKLSDENKFQDLATEELKVFMVAASDFYNHQEYDQAADAFYTLTVLAPTSPILWKCLGNAKYFGKNYKDAFEAYEMAFSLDPSDLDCVLFQARCLQNDGRQHEAIDRIHHLVEHISRGPQSANWHEKATALLKDLEGK